MKLNVDFHRDSMQGQLLPSEREALYNTLIKYQPKTMIEIGTWKGGGSTYFIAAAAYEYGGHLHTIELNPDFHYSAIRLFTSRMMILMPHVTFYLGKSQNVIPQIFKRLVSEIVAPPEPILDEILPIHIPQIDFVLFDGAEDADQTVLEYDLLNQHLPIGSIIACHDWKTLKMQKMKDVIANDNTWHPIVEIDDTLTGFRMFLRSV